MIIKIKPKIDDKTKKLFEKLLSTTDKTYPLHFKFIKTLPIDMRDLLMSYFSYTRKIDLKEYEQFKLRYKTNDRLMIDSILSIIMDYKESEIWKDDQPTLIRGINLGTLYQIQYKNYQHDPFPLAFFLNQYDSKHGNFQAINLHYFIPSFREHFLKQVLQINKPRIASNKPIILTMDIVKKLVPDLGIALRNYKGSKIKVIEPISHTRWLTYLKIESKKIF